jgi:CRP-like cAMP-binding protein
MFVVSSGEVVVTLESPGQPSVDVARIGPGGFFGEMSLLTGAPRSATVTTAGDAELLEITADAFRAFVLENPECVDRISAAVATRAAELDAHRAATAAVAVEGPSSFRERVRRFLRLSAP